jgi:hypothetical protein
MSTKRKYNGGGAASRKKTKTQGLEVLLAEALKEIKELRKEVNQMKSSHSRTSLAAKPPSHSHVYHHKDPPPPPSPPIPFIPRFKKGDCVYVHLVTCPVRRTPMTLSATVVRVSPSEERRSDHVEGSYDVRLLQSEDGVEAIQRNTRLFTTGFPHRVDILGQRIIKNLAEDSLTESDRDSQLVELASRSFASVVANIPSIPYMPHNVIELD